MSKIIALATIFGIISGAVVVLHNKSHPDHVLFLAKLMIFLSITAPSGIYASIRLYGKNTTKTIALNSALLCFTLVVCLALSEWIVRIYYSNITTTEDNSSYFALRWMANNPPLINDFGFRERYISTDKAKNSYRIAVIGDSFTYGQGIPESARFSNLLEARLADHTTTFEVLNFGRPGAETVDETQILRKFVLGTEPDYILLQWFVNDVEGNDYSERPMPYRLLPSDYLTRQLHKHSALYYLLNSKWKELQQYAGLTVSYQAYMNKRFMDPDSKASLQATGQFQEFINLADANGVPLGVVFFPMLQDTQGSADKYPFSYLIDRYMKICELNGISCLDMRQHFKDVSPASRLWVNKFDKHPGVYANKIASDVIYSHFHSEWTHDTSEHKP